MKKLFVLMVSFALLGCLGRTPESKFYLLESFDTMAVVSTRKVNLAVADIVLPAYLQKPQIVLQDGLNPKLEISEFNRWASDLAGMLQNTLIEDLQKALPNAEIKPLLYGSRPRFIVKVNIEKLSGWFKKDAILTGSFQIVNAANKVLAEENFSVFTPAGKTYETFVSAESALWSSIAAQIAVRVDHLM